MVSTDPIIANLVIVKLCVIEVSSIVFGVGRCDGDVSNTNSAREEAGSPSMPAKSGFHLITSKFLYFQLEARCSEDLERENHSA